MNCWALKVASTAAPFALCNLLVCEEEHFIQHFKTVDFLLLTFEKIYNIINHAVDMKIASSESSKIKGTYWFLSFDDFFSVLTSKFTSSSIDFPFIFPLPEI